MARLESNAKMGYYPTPQKTLEIISTWIQKYRYEMTQTPPNNNTTLTHTYTNY